VASAAPATRAGAASAMSETSSELGGAFVHALDVTALLAAVFLVLAAAAAGAFVRRSRQVQQTESEPVYA
jgi:hypothetical protein